MIPVSVQSLSLIHIWAINDAINGIMTSMVEDKTNIAFGIIPNGIGNDFAKYWGLDGHQYFHMLSLVENLYQPLS